MCNRAKPLIKGVTVLDPEPALDQTVAFFRALVAERVAHLVAEREEMVAAAEKVATALEAVMEVAVVEVVALVAAQEQALAAPQVAQRVPRVDSLIKLARP